MAFLAMATTLPAATATAATTNYLVTGQLGVDLPSDGTDVGLDRSTFELRVTFDEPTLPDPERSSFATPTLTYLAQAWSLAYFRGGAIIAETNSDLNPEALAFAELSGRLTGPDSGETFLTVGVEDGPVGTAEPLFGSLIVTEFITPTLVDTFFTNQLIDVPGNFESSGGSAFDASRGFFLEVQSASFTAVSIDDGVVLAPGQDNGTPDVIPTPSAAAGGAFLLMGLLSRRRRAAANPA